MTARYLSVEHGAGAALGALGLACADLFELRTGEAQRVTVSRAAAGLATVRRRPRPSSARRG